MNFSALHDNYLFLAGIVVLTIFLTFIIERVLQRLAVRISKRTSTGFDDALLMAVHVPLRILLYVAGLAICLKLVTIKSPLDLWASRVVYAAAIVLFASIVSRSASLLISRSLRIEKKTPNAPGLLDKVVAIIVYLIAALIILKAFNVEITPLIATLGVGGLAIGLALQPTLSNLFSGIFIISDKPLQVGDMIEITSENLSGYVTEIGWRTTRIQTLPDTLVIVPNAKLADSIIVNRSLPKPEMSFGVQCGVAYGSDLEKVERVTIEVARKLQNTIPGAVRNYEPSVRFHTFADSNINFSIGLRIESYVDQYLLAHELIKALSARFATEGIDMSFPVRKIVQG